MRRRRMPHWPYAEAQLAAARKAMAEDIARLREAELNLSRQQQLTKAQLVGHAVLDTVQANVDALQARIAYTTEQVSVAEAQVALRRADVDDTIMRAPFGGVAISKDAQPGEMISPISAGGGFTRTGICTIVDMASLEIEVDRQRGLHQPRQREPAGGSRARRLSRLANPRARRRRGADRRSTEGDGEGAHRLRSARSAHPAGHGRQGVVPRFRERKPAAASDGRASSSRKPRPGSKERSRGGERLGHRLRRARRSHRAARRALGRERGGDVEVLSGLADGERRGRRRADRRCGTATPSRSC